MVTPLSTAQHRRRTLFLMMICMSFLCLLMGSARIHITGSLKGIFLVWNLFLAWVPFLIAYYLGRGNDKPHRVLLSTGLLVWLLFLPNAPYIITDLIHLRPRDGVPLWFDAMIIFIFAFHGLILGIVSVLFVHELLNRYMKRITAWILLAGVFVLTGYGIYLGRFLRWNSWDIVVKPIALLSQSFDRLTHPTAIVVTGLFSLLMFFSYLIFYQLIHMKQNSYDTEKS